MGYTVIRAISRSVAGTNLEKPHHTRPCIKTGQVQTCDMREKEETR